MNYRPFGKQDWQVSALGFGCMRLPVINGDDKAIDIPEATRMVHHAIDQGVNYIDTAFPYHGGKSEGFVGAALKDGYRQKVRLATKMPTWLIDSYADFDLYLNRQLKRLKTDTIDFYLLHALFTTRWDKMRDLGVREWAEKAVASGRIRAIGFSFHDTLGTFKQIIDEYERWDFCQIQYNYLDTHRQAGIDGLHYAASKGLAVVIMEPLLGGRLASPPEQVAEIFRKADPERTPADWALQWLWNQPEVSVVLSGMSTFEQVEQNLVSAGRSKPGRMTTSQLGVINQARVAFENLGIIPCTKCLYCQPCPNGVLIPQLFELFNSGVIAQQMWISHTLYNKLESAGRATSCIDCGECEEKCPQGIPISDWMPYLHKVLSEKEKYDGRKIPNPS
jgi:predicted aldo/keto reductase-like oxidoreductase